LTILLFRQNLLKSLVKYKTNPRGLILHGVCVANSKIKRVAFYHPSLNCFFTTVVFQITLFALYNYLEIRGLGFQSQTSCLLLPARLRNPAASLRRIYSSKAFAL